MNLDTLYTNCTKKTIKFLVYKGCTEMDAEDHTASAFMYVYDYYTRKGLEIIEKNFQTNLTFKANALWKDTFRKSNLQDDCVTIDGDTYFDEYISHNVSPKSHYAKNDYDIDSRMSLVNIFDTHIKETKNEFTYQVFQMKYRLGIGNTDIADELDTSVNTVSAAVLRCKRSILEYMEDLGMDYYEILETL